MARRRTLLAAAMTTALLAGCSGGSGGGGGGGTPAPPADAPVSPVVQQGVTEYRTYVQGQIDELIVKTKVFTDAVRAGDLAAAQAAYAPSREPWERIEPIAGLVEEIDGAVDARVDDFASVDDPEFTGWHRLEYILFAQNTTEGGAPFADQLDADLQTLQHRSSRTVEMPPVDGPGRGIASSSRRSPRARSPVRRTVTRKTDLWDFDANLEGSRAGHRAAEAGTARRPTPPLLTDDRDRLRRRSTPPSPAALRGRLGAVLPENDQYPSALCPGVTVPPTTVDSMKAQLAALSENRPRSRGPWI